MQKKSVARAFWEESDHPGVFENLLKVSVGASICDIFLLGTPFDFAQGYNKLGSGLILKRVQDFTVAALLQNHTAIHQ